LQAVFSEGNTVLMKKRVIGTNYQPVNLLSVSNGFIEIVYEDGDELIHYVDDEGTVLHNPNYPDPDCPCYSDIEQADTSSDFAVALISYSDDFFSIAPAGHNAGGTWLERQITEHVFYGLRRGAV